MEEKRFNAGTSPGRKEIRIFHEEDQIDAFNEVSDLLEELGPDQALAVATVDVDKSWKQEEGKAKTYPANSQLLESTYEKRSGKHSHSSSGTGTGMSNDSDLTLELLEAKLAENQARVEEKKTEMESMAQDVKSTLNEMNTKLDERLNTAEAIEDKVDSNTTWAYRMSAITLTIVSLILAALGVVITILLSSGGGG